MVSNLSGGRWYPSDDIDRAAAAARADERGDYTIAYFAPMLEKDKKYHKIRVDSTRKGIRFQTLEGYYGDNPEPDADALEEAIVSAARRSPFDASEIGMRALVSLGPAPQMAQFRILVNLSDVLLIPYNDRSQGHLSATFAASADGFVSGKTTRVRVDIDFTEAQFRKAAKDGLAILQSIPIPEKTQTVRAMVYDRLLRSVGSVTVPVTLP